MRLGFINDLKKTDYTLIPDIETPRVLKNIREYNELINKQIGNIFNILGWQNIMPKGGINKLITYEHDVLTAVVEKSGRFVKHAKFIGKEILLLASLDIIGIGIFSAIHSLLKGSVELPTYAIAFIWTLVNFFIPTLILITYQLHWYYIKEPQSLKKIETTTKLLKTLKNSSKKNNTILGKGKEKTTLKSADMLYKELRNNLCDSILFNHQQSFFNKTSDIKQHVSEFIENLADDEKNKLKKHCTSVLKKSQDSYSDKAARLQGIEGGIETLRALDYLPKTNNFLFEQNNIFLHDPNTLKTCISPSENKVISACRGLKLFNVVLAPALYLAITLVKTIKSQETLKRHTIGIVFLTLFVLYVLLHTGHSHCQKKKISTLTENIKQEHQNKEIIDYELSHNILEALQSQNCEAMLIK